MSDGTPNGHAIITFDGAEYSVRYKAARRPDSYQMNIWTPESCTPETSGDVEVIANIFGGSVRSAARFRLMGSETWYPMTQYSGLPPYVVAYVAREKALARLLATAAGIADPSDDDLKDSLNDQSDIVGLSHPGPSETAHLWKGTLPANLSEGYHVIEVETTDIFGQNFTGRRIIRVIAEVPAL